MGLNSMALLQRGTEDQKQRFLVPQAKGEKYAAFSLTEPDAGSDVAGMKSTARRDGDEYDVERNLRNARGAIIYEGTSEIHQIMQAGCALDYRKDGDLRCELPAYDEDYWND